MSSAAAGSNTTIIMNANMYAAFITPLSSTMRTTGKSVAVDPRVRMALLVLRSTDQIRKANNTVNSISISGNVSKHEVDVQVDIAFEMRLREKNVLSHLACETGD